MKHFFVARGAPRISSLCEDAYRRPVGLLDLAKDVCSLAEGATSAMPLAAAVARVFVAPVGAVVRRSVFEGDFVAHRAPSATPRLCSAVSVLSDAPVLARAVILRRGNTDADATRLRPLRTTVEASHGLIESLAVALLVHAALDARHLALADAEALQATNRPLLVARAAAASARTIRRGKRVQRRHADRLGQRMCFPAF